MTMTHVFLPLSLTLLTTSCWLGPAPSRVVMKPGADRLPNPTFLIEYDQEAWVGYSAIHVVVDHGKSQGSYDRIWWSETQAQPRTNVVTQIVYGVDPPGFETQRLTDGTRVLGPLNVGDIGAFEFGPDCTPCNVGPPAAYAKFLIAADGRVVLK